MSIIQAIINIGMVFIAPVKALIQYTDTTHFARLLWAIPFPAGFEDYFVEVSKWCNALFGAGFIQSIVLIWIEVFTLYCVIKFILNMISLFKNGKFG